MVSLLFYTLGRYCWRLGLYRGGLNRVQLASLLAFLAALGYAALAGFSLPTVRALVMFGVLLCALQCKNRINLLQAIAIAVISIVVVDPRAVGSASFWLSFSALLVIAFARFRLPGQMRWWQQLLVLQCFFSLLFAPVSVLIFGQFYPAGFLANIVAIPLISFAVLPIILAGCLLLLSGVGGAHTLLGAADGILGVLFQFLGYLVSSGLQAMAAVYPAPLVFIALLSIAAILMPVVPGGRKAASLVLAVTICWQPPRLEHGDYQLVVLDVGMGTSILLRTRNHSLIYDLGPGRPGAFNAVDWALLPAMQQAGIDAPDLLVVSHVDQDHSGGLYSFDGHYRAPRLVSGTPAELKSKFRLKHEVRSCHRYPDWRWDGVTFGFLDAIAATGKISSNNRSCVLSIRGRHSVLLPGDIESSRESKLTLKYASALGADILLAPHHGSKTSSSRAFLKQVNPQHVVFTLAHNNRWKFPIAEVVSRYDVLGTLQYRSDRDGAIRITSTAEGLDITGSRKPIRRIWRRW